MPAQTMTDRAYPRRVHLGKGAKQVHSAAVVPNGQHGSRFPRSVFEIAGILAKTWIIRRQTDKAPIRQIKSLPLGKGGAETGRLILADGNGLVEAKHGWIFF